jgi:hypothetical protein
MGLGLLFVWLMNFIRYARIPVVREGNRIFYGNDEYTLVQSKEDIFPDIPPGTGRLREELTLAAANAIQSGNCSPGRQRLSLDEALAIGMIFTADETAFLRSHPDVSIAPYIVPYSCMQGLQDAIDCEQNLTGSVPDSLPAYEREYLDVICPKIDDLNQERAVSRTFYCPVLVGLSMGGMMCHALGAKYGRMSIAFNPLGHGSGVKEWVGIDRWNGAYGTDAQSHLTIITEGDTISDPRHASATLLRGVPGTRRILPNCLPLPNKFCTHNDIDINLRNFLSSLPSRDEPSAAA